MGLRACIAVIAVSVASPGFVGGAGAELPDCTLFEAGQVRPLAMSPNGMRLFAVNTPNAQLEIYELGAAKLSFVAAVPVGLEPVAVALLAHRAHAESRISRY